MSGDQFDPTQNPRTPGGRPVLGRPLTRQIVCPGCNGSGDRHYLGEPEPRACPACDGSGKLGPANAA